MTNIIIPAHNTAHIQIDVQAMALAGLSSERAKSFADGGESFISALGELGVPTIKAVFGQEPDFFKFYFGSDAEKRAAEVGVYASSKTQALLIKGEQDAFYSDHLKDYLGGQAILNGTQKLNEEEILKGQPKTHLIVTGMRTDVCVLQSLASVAGRLKDLTCHVAYDLLAEPGGEPRPNNPEWHRDRLQKILGNQPNIFYHTTEELLTSLQGEPAPPAKKTAPVSQARVLNS